MNNVTKYSILAFIFIVMVIWINVNDINRYPMYQYSPDSIDHFDKVYTGVVSGIHDVPENDSYAIIEIHIPDNQMGSYNPSDSLDVFCCLIEGSRGLFLSLKTTYSEGDIVILNGPENTIHVHTVKGGYDLQRSLTAIDYGSEYRKRFIDLMTN
jgi:hypothetical protein